MTETHASGFEEPIRATPEGWISTRLGDFCTVIAGQSPPGTTYNADGDGLPFFQGKAEFGERYPVVRKWCSEPNKIVQKDDVLVSIRAPVGPANLSPGKVAIGRGLAGVQPLSDISPLFILHGIRAKENTLREKATGTTFQAISSDVLKSLPFPLPPLAEQNRIVAKIEELFSKLDAGVAGLKRTQALLKRYRQSLLHAAVTGELTRGWREQQGDGLGDAADLLNDILAERRHQWQESGKKGKYEEPAAPDVGGLPKLPQKWVWTNIDQIGTVVRGASPRPAGDPRFFGGDVPWITVGELTKDTAMFLKHVSSFVTIEGKERSRYIEPNTFLLTNSGATLGVPKITQIGGCINDGSVAILGLSEDLKKFLYFVLTGQTERLRRINQGAAQPNLNTTIVRQIHIPFPPLAEQVQIVAEVLSS